jgi:lipoyl synthase
MLGCGETPDEVEKLMEDLYTNKCDVLTLGQYLQPTKMHLNVAEFVHPDMFKKWEKLGLDMGFRFVESGPMVRSSYHAEKHVL